MDLPKTVLSILKRIQRAGFTAYVVGGCVRNHFLGLPLGDIDLCTNASPQDIVAIFSDYKVDLQHQKFGTAFLYIDNKEYQITRFRKENAYKDARHPSYIQFVESFYEDAPRRDFTANAIAYHPAVGFLDFFNGIEDIKAGVLRFIGDPANRIGEDHLRILRAFRFLATYPLSLDEAGKQAIKENIYYITDISPSVTYKEFIHTLQGSLLEKVLEQFPLFFFYFFHDIQYFVEKKEDRAFWIRLLKYCIALQKRIDLLPIAVFLEVDLLKKDMVNKLVAFGIRKTKIQFFNTLLDTKSRILKYWREEAEESFVQRLRLLALETEYKILKESLTLCSTYIETNYMQDLQVFQEKVQIFEKSLVHSPLIKKVDLALESSEISKFFLDNKQSIKNLLKELCIAIEKDVIKNTKIEILDFINGWKNEKIKCQ